MRRVSRGYAAAWLLVGLAASPASALDWTCLSNNSGVCSGVATQLSLTVTDPGAVGGDVTFKFQGIAGAVTSFSIGQLYFDQTGSLLSAPSLNNGTGVSFAIGATPADLPGGNNATPPFVADFAFGADSPAPSNGINIGEFLEVTFLTSGSLQDVLDDLGDGDLRIGAHVISINGGTSDSLICCGTQGSQGSQGSAGSEGSQGSQGSEGQTGSTEVPEPGSLLLLGLGVIAAGAASRMTWGRRQK